ncbi:MAG: hypothetical protein HY736_20785 [Verrucomicrobia bacterium]|nr:hypothetical protein [Verrucomicrobiota bacterium]
MHRRNVRENSAIFRTYEELFPRGKDGVLFFKRHYEGGYIYSQQIVVEATPDDKALLGWRINYGYQDETPNVAPKLAETRTLPDQKGIAFDIDVVKATRPGIKAKLRIEARPWT